MSFRDGDKVSYKIGDFIQGVGVVRGISTMPIYGIGAVYIIEDTSGQLPNASYQFKFFTCAELYLEALK